MTTLVPSAAFVQGVLKPERHERLVLDIDRYAERAGIDPRFIWTSARKTLHPEELDYLVHFGRHRRKGMVGLVYIGDYDVTERMALMAGALVRAFVDARVMTAAQVVQLVYDGEYPEATVLLIPNFFSAKEFGAFEQRRIAALCEVLFNRAARGEQTVISVDCMKTAKSKLGAKVFSIINEKMFEVGAEVCQD